MSYSQATFSPNQFWQESYQQHQSQPQVSTVSFHEFGHRIAPHRHCGLSTDLCFSQPRYLPPQDLARLSTFQEHHREESYTALSDSHAAKGRSFSGTNTDSTEYDFAVVSTSPRTAYFLGGAGGQYAIAKYMPDEAEEKSPHGISLSDFGQLENGNYPISLPQQDACIAASSNR